MELRSIVTVAVSAMVTVLGLLWYTSRKKHKAEGDDDDDKEIGGAFSKPGKIDSQEEKDVIHPEINAKMDFSEESHLVTENGQICTPLVVNLSPSSGIEASIACQSSPTLPVSGEPENEFDTPEVATYNTTIESALPTDSSAVPVKEDIVAPIVGTIQQHTPTKPATVPQQNGQASDSVDGAHSGMNGGASSNGPSHNEPSVHSVSDGCVGASSEVLDEKLVHVADRGDSNGVKTSNQNGNGSHMDTVSHHDGGGDTVEVKLTNGQLKDGDCKISPESTPEHTVTEKGDGNTDNNAETNGYGRKGHSSKGDKKHISRDPHDIIRYEFEFPSELCGRLIGKHGSTITSIKNKSDTEISLSRQSYNETFQICAIEGTKEDVDYALKLIRRKFPKSQFPNVDFRQLSSQVQEASPVLAPEMMQLTLPEGVMVDVIVSSIVNASHVFVQQPTHPTYPSLERLNQFMIMCYQHDGIVPQLPRPIEVGVICAGPMMEGWYRAQVVSVLEETDECDIKYVDYGGYARIQACALKQIRSDFMTLPFQACEAYLANITPLEGEEGYSLEASAVLEEISQGRMLQLQTVSTSVDGVPCVQLYTQGAQGTMPILINRDLVDRGVVRWEENQEKDQVEF